MSRSARRVEFRVSGEGIVAIRLNRPERGNAFDAEMAMEIARAFRAADKQPGARVVLLSGHGKHFCTGADLKWMANARHLSASENGRDAERLATMYQAILDCGVPVIARVHGKVRGGGVGLTAASDIAVCLTGTTFALPEARLGLVSGVLTPIAVRKMGISRFLDFALTGREIPATEAREAGLVRFVGGARPVERFLSATIRGILECSPTALRKIKAMALSESQSSREELARRLRLLARSTAQARVSKDAQDRLAGRT